MSRSALVTGGTGGIGSAIVRRLRANGYEVVFCGRDEQRAAALERDTGAVFCQADSTDRAACDASVAFALERLGHVNLFVANAGILVAGPLAETTDEDFELLLEANLTSTFRYARAVFEPMRRQSSGVMVLIASDSAVRGSHRLPAYSVVKAGMVALAELFGAEGAPYGIRAKCCLPGQHAARDGRRRSGGLATDRQRGLRDVRRGGVNRGVPGLAAGGAHQRRHAAHRRWHGSRAPGRYARLISARTAAPTYGAGGGFLTAPVGFGFEDFATASRAIALGFAERSVSVTSCSGLLSPRP